MPLPTFKQVKSVVLAVRSGKDKKLQKKRDAICEKCPHLFKAVSRSRLTNKLQVDKYCGKCGCGTGPMAGLRNDKTAWRKATCPMKKWPGDKKRRGGLSIKELGRLVNVYERVELHLATIQMHIDDGKPLTDEQFSELSGRELQQLRAINPQGMNRQNPNPKAGAVAAAAARTRPVAKMPTQQAAMVKVLPGVGAMLDRTAEDGKDQIPDELVKKHLRKIGAKPTPAKPAQPAQ